MFNNTYRFEEITGLHIELTSVCNLMCSQCARVKNGAILSNLPLKHLSSNIVKKVVDELGDKLEYVHLCGNYGDPILYPNLLDVVSYINKSGHTFIKIYTNGSIGKSHLWSSLGEILNGKRGHVVFSLDGLEDTNHLYRNGANWKNIINNARSFIEAGGDAIWEWLPFEHNDHQVEEAKILAKEMGFKAFILKRNPRFSTINNGEDEVLRPSQKFVHKGAQKVESKYRGKGFSPTLYPIRCKYKARKMLYIDFEGLVLPCCWLANRFKGDGKFNEMEEIIRGYGHDEFSLYKNGLEEILKNNWYQKDMDYTLKIMNACRKHCSLDHKMSNNQNRDVFEFSKFYDPEPWEGKPF